MLKSMRKSTNRYFFHILVSPGDAPGAITLNAVSMEREFDAYKLPRCMCPSNYNRFSDTARYWSKIVIFHTPLDSMPPLVGFPLEHRHPFRYGKTRMAWLPDGEKFRTYPYSFWRNSRKGEKRTDRHTPGDSIPRLCIASRG